MDDDDLPNGPEPYTIPLAPPGSPPADFVFFRRPISEAAATRESEDIMLRRVPTAVAMRFRAAAGGRGMTHAQYLAAIVALHEAVRTGADVGDAELATMLEKLGLQTVSV
jgi:hypothetical protein